VTFQPSKIEVSIGYQGLHIMQCEKGEANTWAKMFASQLTAGRAPALLDLVQVEDLDLLTMEHDAVGPCLVGIAKAT
jgi:hypothetical protein